MTTLQQAGGDAPLAAASKSLWALGWQRLKRDRVGFVSLWIVIAFMLLAVGGWFNLVGGNWNQEVGKPYAPPTWFQAWGPGHVELTADDIAKANAHADASAGAAEGLSAADDPLAADMADVEKNAAKYQVADVARADTLAFGADQRGRSVVDKVLKGTATSLFVGFFGALLAVLIGSTLGAIAGYFGRKVDDFLMWFYSVFTAVPDMLLLLAFAAVSGRGLGTIIMVMSFTTWTGTFRLVRAEFMKNRSREYVQAADAIGASHWRRIFIHILPNISHLLLVQFSLLMVGLIKYEVILSFLGFGVGVTQVSWGSILAEVPAELMQGYWWQLAAVVMAMSLLVTAFSMLTDSLRDALDPKVK
ncbi:peptide ABC transporter permease [Xenophilus sp. AP218F]|nr:ABC transporter permease [Chromobacterium sp. ASV5]OWY40145.1 peptide ABC transporter permease [Xenophilus sp. AP218F]